MVKLAGDCLRRARRAQFFTSLRFAQNLILLVGQYSYFINQIITLTPEMISNYKIQTKAQ
jgi:hypothetical protein